MFYSMLEEVRRFKFTTSKITITTDRNIMKSDIRSSLRLLPINPAPASSTAIQKVHLKQFSKKSITLSKTIDIILNLE